MPIPDFVADLRKAVGTKPLWLSCVTAVVTRADEVLLVRRSDTGEWAPVAGIIDPGEQPAAAAIREVLEEAGIYSRPVRIAGVGVTEPVTYSNGDRSQYLNVVFLMEWVSGDPFPADGEATEARWVDRRTATSSLYGLSKDSQRWLRWGFENLDRAAFVGEAQ